MGNIAIASYTVLLIRVAHAIAHVGGGGAGCITLHCRIARHISFRDHVRRHSRHAFVPSVASVVKCVGRGAIWGHGFLYDPDAGCSWATLAYPTALWRCTTGCDHYQFVMRAFTSGCVWHMQRFLHCGYVCDVRLAQSVVACVLIIVSHVPVSSSHVVIAALFSHTQLVSWFRLEIERAVVPDSLYCTPRRLVRPDAITAAHSLCPDAIRSRASPSR